MRKASVFFDMQDGGNRRHSLSYVPSIEDIA